LNVPTPGNGELWWVLGTFVPSVGISSFRMIDQLQASDPDQGSVSMGVSTGDVQVLELVGGSGPNEGNILLNGRPVCDDGYQNYGPQNAQVVCRMLGYTSGTFTTNSQFGPVSDVFAMDEVQCTGDEEYIWRCPHSIVDDCSGSEGFGVICSNDEPITADSGHGGSGSGSGWAEVELVGGSGPNEGNILVWGQPVCDDDHPSYGAQNALVVCRMLGYFSGSYTPHSHFGPVTTNFGMDDVHCVGNETSINDCPHNDQNNCGAGEGLGVICREIGLVGGSGPYEGNILVRGEPVCDDVATPENAQVVCRQLGYLGGQITVSSYFGDVSDDFVMDNVECTGNESYIWRCPHLTEDNCGGHEAMGVICSNGVDVSVSVHSATTDGSLEGASVEFTLGGLVLSGTTDSEGVAVFTLSPDAPIGQSATIVVSREGYSSVTVQRLIDTEVWPSEHLGQSAHQQLINIFASPELAEGEHRIVLSWETERDLDIYALGRDRTTGEIVCKTWYADRSGCAGVNLDVDNTFGYGPETITWTDADNDAYVYELYVNDFNGIGIAGTGAHIVLYGESTIELDVETVGSEEMWWMLGTFEPSVGISSFQEVDALQTSNPDDREETAIARQLSRSKKWRGGKKPKGKKLKKDKKEE